MLEGITLVQFLNDSTSATTFELSAAQAIGFNNRRAIILRFPPGYDDDHRDDDYDDDDLDDGKITPAPTPNAPPNTPAPWNNPSGRCSFF